MIRSGQIKCPDCGGRLKYYDRVPRILRTKGRTTTYIQIRRFRCINCGKIHRELPEYLLPYKQYEKDVVEGVIHGYITPDTLGYEDYPCEMTMKRWKKYTQKIQLLL